MLESDTFEIDGELHAFRPEIRCSHDVPMAMQFWVAYFARHLLRLGVFLHGASIMLQIPGGARFGHVTDDGCRRIGRNSSTISQGSNSAC